MSVMLSLFRKRCIGLLMVLASTNLFAEELPKPDPIYQVEILVLQRADAEITQPSTFNMKRFFPPQAELAVMPAQELTESDTDIPESNNPVALSSDAWQIAKEADKLKKSGDFIELLHLAWHQSAKTQKATPWVAFDSRQFADADSSSIFDSLSNKPYVIGTFKFTPSRFIDISSQVRLYDNNDHLLQYFSQTRRLRRNQLNYLDHPVLAVLVKITPVSAAERLSSPAGLPSSLPAKGAPAE